MSIKVVIGADHRGYNLKELIKSDLNYHIKDIELIDIGAFNSERTDYPIFSIEAAHQINSGAAQAAILLCATGIGMTIAANRFPGIYAGLIWDKSVAEKAKEDDNINILVLPADYINADQALEIIKAWFYAQFKGNQADGQRYLERIKMIDNIK